MSVKDLISAAFNKDASTFEATLHAIMQEKMSAAVQAQFSPAVYEEEVDLDEAKADDSEDDESTEEDDDEEDMKEEVEQIDEISGAKIGTYLIKARKSEAELDKKRDASYDKEDTPENKVERKKLTKAMNKRRWGQGKAMDKLTGSSFAKVPATEK